MRILAVALGASIVAGATPAMAGKFGNGSFESPELQSCCTQTFNRGDKIGPWTVIGPHRSKVVLTSTDYVKGAFSFLSKDGVQWLNISGKAGAGVEQRVSITPSTTYIFSFYVGSVYDPTGKYGKSSSVKVLVNGSEVGPFKFDALNDGHNKQQWQKFSIQVQSGDSHISLALVNADPDTDLDCGIDLVTFKKE